MASAITKRLNGPWPVAGLFVLLLASLFLFSSATQNSQAFGRQYLLLLALVIVELLVLAALIGLNLQRLLRQYRNRATGSRITARLVVMFIALAVLPSSVLYYFSVDFIRKGIDSWFDVKVEQALEDSLNLSRSALNWRLSDLHRQVGIMAEDISQSAPATLDLTLDELRRRSGALEINLVTAQGASVAYSSELAPAGPPQRPGRLILEQLQSNEYVGLEHNIGDHEGQFARIVVFMPELPENNVTIMSQTMQLAAKEVVPDFGGQRLQVIFAIPAHVSVLAESVKDAAAHYERLEFLRGPLKFSFILTLTLVLALTLFTAVWAAFYFAKRLIAPIRILAIGTRAVTSGDYHRRLPVSSFANDELGFLVQSFNIMMGRIANAQGEVQRSHQDAEKQRAYLEAVLCHLSSGVMTFSADGNLRTANPRADQILGVSLTEHLSLDLNRLAADHAHLQSLVDLLGGHLAAHDDVWEEELVLFGPEGRQILMCRGVALPSGEEGEDGGGGEVVVFEDVTSLIQAQRDAAWGEVARRLAHEIKNPLTPIQLSAERLRHKYLPNMTEEEGAVLGRATHTIVQQVEAMKKMVQAFSDYARSPKLEVVAVDFNALIDEVAELYVGNSVNVEIKTQLDSDLDSIDADAGRLRQLLHNLIKNGIEACNGSQAPCLTIQTRLFVTEELKAVELNVYDNGPGIPSELLEHLFEPYVSAKPKGSGLGLAIVKKIVEEHHGVVWVENEDDGGARFIIRMPLTAKHEMALNPGSRQRSLFE